LKFNLQLFAEQNLQNQTSNQLRKGIRYLKKDLELHLKKIEHPADYCIDWNILMNRFKTASRNLKKEVNSHE